MDYIAPALNGDHLGGVAVAGELTDEQIGAAISAGGFKSWLFLNQDSKAEESGLKLKLAGQDVAYCCVPVDKDALTPELATAVVAALDALAVPQKLPQVRQPHVLGAGQAFR